MGNHSLKSVQFHAPFNTLTRLAAGFGLKGYARPLKDSPQNIGSPASKANSAIILFETRNIIPYYDYFYKNYFMTFFL